MKIVIAYLLIVSSLFSSGQVSIINRSLTDSSLDIAYVGVDNHIALKGINNFSTLIISVTNGTIEKYVANDYIFRTSNTGSSTINVKQNGKIIASKTFKGEMFPSEVIRLGNLKDSILSIRQIQLNPFLVIVLPNCLCKYNFQIVSFSAIFFKHETKDSIITTAKLHQFSPEQLAIIKELKPGDTIYFSNIRFIGGPDDARVPPLRVYIK